MRSLTGRRGRCWFAAGTCLNITWKTKLRGTHLALDATTEVLSARHELVRAGRRVRVVPDAGRARFTSHNANGIRHLTTATNHQRYAATSFKAMASQHGFPPRHRACCPRGGAGVLLVVGGGFFLFGAVFFFGGGRLSSFHFLGVLLLAALEPDGQPEATQRGRTADRDLDVEPVAPRRRMSCA